MKNKFCLTLLGLLVLTACSDKNNNTGTTNIADNNSNVSSQKEQGVTQEQLFLKIQKRQIDSAEQMQNFLKDLRASVDSEEKAEEAKKQLKDKYDSLNAELKSHYEGLNITDSDIKEYLKLQEDLLSQQKELGIEASRLQKLSKNGKQKLSKEQMQKYVEIDQKIDKITQNLLTKKILLDEKFANSASGALKEYYKITNIVNLETKSTLSIAEKLSADKSITSNNVFNQKFLAEIQKINEDIISQLAQLEISDSDLKEYKNLLINMMQKRLTFFKQSPAIQKEYSKNKKLSASNEIILNELKEAEKMTSEQLNKILTKLTK